MPCSRKWSKFRYWPKKDLHTVLDLLYAKGTVHIEDASAPVAPGEITLKKMTGEQAGDISVALSKIGGIFLTLPKIKVDEKAAVDYLFQSESEKP